MEIERTTFGSITIDGKTYEHDVIIHLSGEVAKRIRDRFGWDAIGYGSAAPGVSRSVPDEFRKLAQKNL